MTRTTTTTMTTGSDIMLQLRVSKSKWSETKTNGDDKQTKQANERTETETAKNDETKNDKRAKGRKKGKQTQNKRTQNDEWLTTTMAEVLGEPVQKRPVVVVVTWTVMMTRRGLSACTLIR